MDIKEILVYTNAAVVGMVFVLAAVHYVRLRFDLYIALAAGGLFYLAGYAWYAVSPGPTGPNPVIELTVAALWCLAYAWKDRPGKVRVAILFVGFLVVSVVLAVIQEVTGGNSWLSVFYHLFRFGMAFYALAYAVSRPAPGRHYFVQGFFFFIVVYAISALLGFLPLVKQEPLLASTMGMFHGVGTLMGCLSMALFTDAVTAARGGQKLRREMIARVFEMTPQITQQLKALGDSAALEMGRPGGIEFVARAVEENFGYTEIYIGIPEEGEALVLERVSEKRENSGPPLMELPQSILSEVLNARYPLLVPDTESDPRLPQNFADRTGMESFIVAPFQLPEQEASIMLVGGRADGVSLDENDAALLDITAGRVSEALESLSHDEGTEVSSDMDAVTRLRNFSSFQKLLGEEIAEADKNSRTFALLLFDMDHFSDVNEELGYEKGDIILKEIGERLSVYASEGMAGRVGADEFAIIMPGQGPEVREQVEKVLGEVNQGIKGLLSDKPITLSAGYSIYPFDFLEQTGVFGKMREMLATGGSTSARIVRVKLG